MRSLKLTIAYDGTDYAGWQVQRSRTPTIQGTLEQALQRILGEHVRVVGSGRTDAGVHALAQVAHARVRSSMPCRRLQAALNGVLPADVVVTRIEEAPPSFHARFDAKAKRYRYVVVTGPVVLPFERRYVHHVSVPLDIGLMRREAKMLLGRHDFRAFHNTGRQVSNTRRTVTAIQIRRQGTRLVIDIEASGFLYTMVRGIVGTLIDIGRDHRPPGTMAAILNTTDRRRVGPTAPARGLTLVNVVY